jgi:hypothetical protein
MSDSQAAELNGGLPAEPFDHLLLLRMSAARRRLEREHWARQAVLAAEQLRRVAPPPEPAPVLAFKVPARPRGDKPPRHMLGEVIAFPHRS